MNTDHDSPWKETLDSFFFECLQLLFPALFALIDWSKKIESDDPELRQLTGLGESNPLRVDKLFKVWLKSGESRWIWIHIELQAQWDADFPERMFVYWCRLFQKHRRMLVSLAILADDNPKWRPDRFELELGGCSNKFHYPVAKLKDFEKRRSELEASDNPFMLLILAHLDTMATTGDFERRMNRKLALTRNLFERGIGKERIAEVYRLLDWMMQLPPELKQRWYNEVNAIMEVQKMPFVSTAEWVGEQRGLDAGLTLGQIKTLKEILPELLSDKFGAPGTQFGEEIQAWDDLNRLKSLRTAIRSATSVDEIRQFVAN